jgi:hypothetical protein
MWYFEVKYDFSIRPDLLEPYVRVTDERSPVGPWFHGVRYSPGAL